MTTPDPILILGIMQRSGTNWMRDLLLCHSDCYGAKIQEDFLLANSRLLLRFGSSLYRTWPEKWRADQRAADQVVQRHSSVTVPLANRTASSYLPGQTPNMHRLGKPSSG